MNAYKQAMPTGRQAIILNGPPGAGKGTQAELLAKRFYFFHFDTGRYIERLLYAPGAQNDPVLARERANFEAGKLATAEWVLGIMRDKVTRLAASDTSVVFSGSPRSELEAFGGDGEGGKEEGLLELLAREYGMEHISVIALRVPPEESMKRNSSRLICSICGLPVMGGGADRCNFCGGKLIQRTLDNPEDIRARLKEYEEQTVPLLAKMRGYGIAFHEVSGVGAPYEIHERIVKLFSFA